jgi:hypothetical protein
VLGLATELVIGGGMTAAGTGTGVLSGGGVALVNKAAAAGPAAAAAAVAATSWASAATSLAQGLAAKEITACALDNCENWALPVRIMIGVIRVTVDAMNLALSQSDNATAQGLTDKLGTMAIALDRIADLVEEACPTVAMTARMASQTARENQNRVNSTTNSGTGGGATPRGNPELGISFERLPPAMPRQLTKLNI